VNPSDTLDHLREERRVEVLTDVQVAAELFAPLWPLTSFVAVNPLGGIAHRSFGEAAALARSWLGARSHLELGAYRRWHRDGTIPEAALRHAVLTMVPAVAAWPRVDLGRCRLAAVDLVLLDLLHGPEVPRATPIPTAAQRALPPLADETLEAVDALVAAWCAAFVDEATAGWTLPDRGLGLFRSWRSMARYDRRLRSLVGRAGARWLGSLPDDAVEALDLALDELEVPRRGRASELRAQFARLPGWTGYARWCDTWAPEDHDGPRLHLHDLAAVRTAIEAALVRASGSVPDVAGLGAPNALGDALPAGASGGGAGEPDPRRVDALLELVGAEASDVTRERVAAVLVQVPEAARGAIWLDAHEAAVRDRVLALLADRSAAAPAAGEGANGTGTPSAGSRPAAQVLTCIDVRSEGLRRHLEARGGHETFGVAGFFGIPAHWRPVGSDRTDPRSPVLVTPSHEIVERPAPGAEPAAAHRLAHGRSRRTVKGALQAAKADAGAPFVFAESAGWVLGATAAARTLRPPRAPRSATTRAGALGTVVDVHGIGSGGFTLEERVAFAGGLLRAVGLTERFAPLVVLCGHGSATVNNPHASSLDCGACGGAPGGASARIAAALCNDPEVRAALAEDGLRIPADTWFLAAEHDTTADQVAILEGATLPARHAERLVALEADLEAAGAALAAERATRLPGDPARVRARGRDWAELRPEWGLARNAAFIVGPRSMTAGRDLDGRAFLHSYDAAADRDGRILTTILTAPLVVAQWISAQYYFSTVDPEVFGAGDKLLHNPVGGIGVTLGDGGDLQVGLPLQSVAVGGHPVHEPVRLLAVVQAPRDRVAAIIQAHEVLRELVGGSWIAVAVREHEDDPFTLLEPDGRWTPWRATPPTATPVV
jgi:uncharacterized protein